VFIAWKDDYSVGHAELDGHHKKAVSIMNDLYAAIQEGKHRVQLNGILARLFEYTQLHFRREERLMAEPDISHLAEAPVRPACRE
jgi:hemerythrin